MFMYSMNRAREVRKYHVAVVQRGLRNEQKVWCTCKVVVLLLLTYCFFPVLVAVAVVIALAPYCCDKKICYHGNVTSSFSSLFQPHTSLANKEMSDFKHRISKLVNPTQKIVSKVPILVNLLSITGEGIWRQILRDKRDNHVCKEFSDELFPPLNIYFLLKTRKLWC